MELESPHTSYTPLWWSPRLASEALDSNIFCLRWLSPEQTVSTTFKTPSGVEKWKSTRLVEHLFFARPQVLQRKALHSQQQFCLLLQPQWDKQAIHATRKSSRRHQSRVSHTYKQGSLEFGLPYPPHPPPDSRTTHSLPIQKTATTTTTTTTKFTKGSPNPWINPKHATLQTPHSLHPPLKKIQSTSTGKRKQKEKNTHEPTVAATTQQRTMNPARERKLNSSNTKRGIIIVKNINEMGNIKWDPT